MLPRAGLGRPRRVWALTRRPAALCLAPAVFLLDGRVRVSRSTLDSFVRSANIYGTAVLFPSVGFFFLWPSAGLRPCLLWGLCRLERSHV